MAAGCQDSPSVEVQITPGAGSVCAFPTANIAPWNVARSTSAAGPSWGWTGTTNHPEAGVSDGAELGLAVGAGGGGLAIGDGEVLGPSAGDAEGVGCGVELQAARRTVVASTASDPIIVR